MHQERITRIVKNHALVKGITRDPNHSTANQKQIDPPIRRLVEPISSQSPDWSTNLQIGQTQTKSFNGFSPFLTSLNTRKTNE